MGERVAIVGSRDYPDENVVRAFVRSLPPGTVVVSGGASGVDRWAEEQARRCGLNVESYPVNMARVQEYEAKGVPRRAAYGKAAYERNRVIAEKCDRLVAFSYCGSRGTASTVGYAEAFGKPYKVWEWPDTPR